MTDVTIPALPAYENEDGTLQVWCEFCTKWHTHGVGGGHRESHCIVEDSPYVITGYVLQLAGPMTDDLRKRHRQRKPKLCRGCSVYLSRFAEECPLCGSRVAVKTHQRVEGRSGGPVPSYVSKILTATRLDPPKPGTVTHVHVFHDDGCAALCGRVCDCDPTVRIG